MVVGRAGGHVCGTLHHQLRGVHAIDRGWAVEAGGSALLRHFHAVVWAGHRDRRPDIAVIRRHERSWLVWLTMLPGLFVLFLVLGEFLVPH